MTHYIALSLSITVIVALFWYVMAAFYDDVNADNKVSFFVKPIKFLRSEFFSK